MKKVVVIAILIFTGSLCTYSQDKKNEIKAGYGILSSYRMLYTIGDTMTSLFANIFSGGKYDLKYNHYADPIFIEYKYKMRKRIKVGFVMSYEYMDGSVFRKKEKTGDFYRYFYTFSPEMDFIYVKTEKVTLYGSLGLGIVWNKENYFPIEEAREYNKRIRPTFHASVFNMQVGKRAGIFWGVGLGYKGLANIGGFYNF